MAEPGIEPDDDSNAEVGQLIAGYSRITRCHVWHRFLTPCLASKSFQTLCLQSLDQLRHLRLHLWIYHFLGGFLGV